VNSDKGVSPRFPDVLLERWGPTASTAMAEYVDGSVRFQLQATLDRLETRSREHLREEFDRHQRDRHEALDRQRRDMRQEWREDFRQELAAGLATQRADIIKWMFVFWVGQATVTVGLILAIK